MEKDKTIRAKITEVHKETSIERSIEVPIFEGYVDMKLPEKGITTETSLLYSKRF